MEILGMPVGPLQANCYILYDETKNALLVDPGGDAPRILAEIQKRGLSVTDILLTHVHFDHMLAAAEVKKATEACLLVPQEDAGALTDPSRSLLDMLPGEKGIALRADRLLRDGDTVKSGEMELRVIATPGHTPGSCCYLCGQALLTGDTLFANSIGRTDFPGGDMAAMEASLKKLSEMEGDYTVLPGHGDSTTLETERRRNPYMR